MNQNLLEFLKNVNRKKGGCVMIKTIANSSGSKATVNITHLKTEHENT